MKDTWIRFRKWGSADGTVAVTLPSPIRTSTDAADSVDGPLFETPIPTWR